MKILFCTDGSTPAENAIRFGAVLAAGAPAEVSVLGIAEKKADQQASFDALQRAQALLQEHHLNPELITKAGRPVNEIAVRTQETHYDLVVIGATRKGHHGPRWMSARAYKIIESIEPPVLVVIQPRESLRQILVCSGGTSQTEKAVAFTAEIARRVNAGVTLFHVLDEPPPIYQGLVPVERDVERVLASDSTLGRSLRRQLQLLDKAGVPCLVRLGHGLVIPELMKELAQAPYDLIVSGSFPSGDRLRKYVMGDVTREILNRAEVPVLVVRTGQAHGSVLRGIVGQLLRTKKS